MAEVEFKKLNEKIKELNSSRVFKKITPKGDITWYIKWTASVFILTAVMCRSVPEVPKIYDLILSLIGCFGWGLVGFMWHDRALIVLNAIGLVFLGMGIIKYLNECNNCMIPL